MSANRYRFTVRGLVEKDGKYLLLQRSKSARGEMGYWELPGGGHDFGESPKETLKREVMEETGIEVEVLKPFSVWDYKRPNVQIIGISLHCRYIAGEIVLSDEHVAYKWLSLEEIKAKKIFPELLAELNQI